MQLPEPAHNPTDILKLSEFFGDLNKNVDRNLEAGVTRIVAAKDGLWASEELGRCGSRLVVRILLSCKVEHSEDRVRKAQDYVVDKLNHNMVDTVLGPIDDMKAEKPEPFVIYPTHGQPILLFCGTLWELKDPSFRESLEAAMLELECQNIEMHLQYVDRAGVEELKKPLPTPHKPIIGMAAILDGAGLLLPAPGKKS